MESIFERLEKEKNPQITRRLAGAAEQFNDGEEDKEEASPQHSSGSLGRNSGGEAQG